MTEMKNNLGNSYGFFFIEMSFIAIYRETYDYAENVLESTKYFIHLISSNI